MFGTEPFRSQKLSKYRLKSITVRLELCAFSFVFCAALCANALRNIQSNEEYDLGIQT